MVMQSSRSVLWWMLLNIILNNGYVSWAVFSILFTFSQILVTDYPVAMLLVPPAITTTLGFLGWFWDWVWRITWVRRWHLLPGYTKPVDFTSCVLYSSPAKCLTILLPMISTSSSWLCVGSVERARFCLAPFLAVWNFEFSLSSWRLMSWARKVSHSSVSSLHRDLRILLFISSCWTFCWSWCFAEENEDILYWASLSWLAREWLRASGGILGEEDDIGLGHLLTWRSLSMLSESASTSLERLEVFSSCCCLSVLSRHILVADISLQCCNIAVSDRLSFISLLSRILGVLVYDGIMKLAALYKRWTNDNFGDGSLSLRFRLEQLLVGEDGSWRSCSSTRVSVLVDWWDSDFISFTIDLMAGMSDVSGPFSATMALYKHESCFIHKHSDVTAWIWRFVVWH